jgi:hypothetical protein
MAANAIPTPELKAVKKKTADVREESAKASVAPNVKERIAKVLHEVFEGHEEYLGMTPD